MKRSTRFRVLTAAGCGGFLGVLAVHIGAWCDIPNFSPRTGYWGSMALNSMLYGMGNDAAAMALISIVWFVYGALLFGAVAAVLTPKQV